MAEGALLGGLITCASCGHKLQVMGTTVKDERVASYVCAKHYANGDCAEPTAARLSLVDEHVVSVMSESWELIEAAGDDNASASWQPVRLCRSPRLT